MINLTIEPGFTCGWDEFTSKKPPYSIALDGYVNAPTKRQTNPPYANYDHHSGCDRIATRSTSEQVAIEINLGLFKTFRVNGKPTANVFLNDIDEDATLAYWLLLNHERVEDHAEPAINRLVYCEDRLDATAGAYPLGDTSFRRQMAWMFEAYQTARFNGKLTTMTGSEMKSLLDSMCSRITAYTLGKCEEIGLTGHYERIGGGRDWAMTKEIGPASRLAMYNDSINAFVSYVSNKSTDRFNYVIGRRSVWVPFDIPTILDRLNEVDSAVTKDNRWGGSNTIGGSPRLTGSALTPSEVEKIINFAIEKIS